MRLSDEVRIGFLGHGAYVPETELTNQDLERIVDTSDEWILRRTGVRARRVLDGRETILDMAVKASRRALAESGVDPADITEVRVATCTWMKLPSLSAHLQRVLALPHASASDVNAGCAGFVYAVEDAWNKLVLERARYGRSSCALVVGVDGLSHITDWTDRQTCVLLGDGAGAVVLGDVAAGGILATHTGADGRHADVLFTESPPCDHRPATNGHPKVTDGGPHQLLRMDGRKVYSAAVHTMVGDVHRVLEKYREASGRDLGVDDVDYLYPHQANLRIIEKIAQRLGVPMEKVYAEGIARYGNTSSASIPLGYEDMRAHHASLRSPRVEVDVAFGAGFASGAILREVVP